MLEPSFFIDLIKYTGFPALIFLIWFIYHQAQNRLWAAMMKAQADMFTQIIDKQTESEKRNYDLLKDLLETNQYNSSILSRLESKIENNNFCPVVRHSMEDKG